MYMLTLWSILTENYIEDNFTDRRDTKDHIEQNKADGWTLSDKTKGQCQQSNRGTDGEEEKGKTLQ